MDSSDTPDVLRNGRRRIYAFLAVALAVFLLGITLIGIVCKGYAIATETAENNPSTPTTSPDEAATALKAASDELKSASLEASAALNAYENANKALAAFVKSHLIELKPADAARDSSTGTGSTIESTLQSVAPPTAASRLTVNPQWKEIHDQFDQLERRRAELLITMMPSHPAVLAVDASIADVELQLKAIPKEIPARADSPNPATLADQTTSKQDEVAMAAAAAAQREAQSQYRKLSDQAEAAHQKYAQALKREDAQRESQQKAEAANVAVLSAPPSSHGSANPHTTIYLCSLLAIVAGLIVASRARVGELTFRTAAEVRQKLGLTILGFLSRRPNEPASEQPRREPRWVTRTVLVAEVCLAAAIACIVVSAFLDKQFFHNLLENPLAACSQKFWC